MTAAATLERSWTFVKRGRFVIECKYVGPPADITPVMPPPAVPHTCRRLDEVEGFVTDCGVYICPWCERPLPWCFGAADDAPAVCDDCWGKLQEKE